MADHPIYVIGLIHFYLFKKTNPAVLLVFPASLSLSFYFFPVDIPLTIKSLYYSTHIQKKTKSLSLPHVYY